MRMIRALWRDGVVYAAGTVLSRGIALLLLPLVTRVLTPSEYGAFDLISHHRGARQPGRAH